MIAGLIVAASFSGVFSDGIVLQREAKVPVWGTGTPDEEVSVSFADQTHRTKVKADGTWRVDLEPMKACEEGRQLVLSAQSRTVVSDVLVGEVWLASGQSNMQVGVSNGNPRNRDADGALAVAMTREPNVRYAQVPARWSVKPRRDLRLRWRDFTSRSFWPAPGGGQLSAVAFYYALEIRHATHVPVGIIDTSWGGTNIEAWIPREAIEATPELKAFADYPVTEHFTTNDWTGVIRADRKQPAVLWNGMVEGLSPLAVRGMIWYQGCDNSWFEPERYTVKMHALRRGWAKKFEHPDLPFYFAQLAPWNVDAWYRLQLAQAKYAHEDPHAAMAVICDHGNFHDIHPNEKAIVAKRLAVHALKRDYGFDGIEDESPEVVACEAVDGALRLTLAHAKSVYLYSKDKSMQPGLEVAGADGNFFPATIRGLVKPSDTVKTNVIDIVSDKVPHPVRVRYLKSSPWIGTIYANTSLPLGPFERQVTDEKNLKVK